MYLDTQSRSIYLKIFEDAQKKLGKGDGEMARLVGLRDARAWQSFKACRDRVSLKPFFKFMDACPFSALHILVSMRKEVLRKK